MSEIQSPKNRLQNSRYDSGVSSSKVNDLLWNFGSWLTEEDKYSDVIISTRVRLARNLKGYPFPNRASNAELSNIAKKVRAACQNCVSLESSHFIDVEKLSDWDSKYFVERRLASPQFVENKIPSLLVIGPQENLSIMVNEEDHLRLQCIEGGLKIQEAWDKISVVDDELEENLNFSYSRKFGYLTAYPTNLGTGMRVSLFVHLPALSIKGRINSIMRKLPTSEIAVRGFYGEGTESIGNIFQISNQLTLGRTEENVVSRINTTAKKLIEIERKARESLLEKDRIRLEDIVFRALGVLQNARIMTSLESMDLLSSLRLGVEIGFVKNITRLAINQLMVLIQPAHLQRIYDQELSAKERDILRAEFMRENLQI
ncbi:MAG: protein arginine kinase [bacterium]